MIDLDRGDDRPTSDAVRALIERTAPVHEQLGLAPFIAQIPVMLKDGNGAQRQIRAFQQGEDPAVTHARAVERTRQSAEEALELVGTVKST
jgi:gamma-glutamyl:cysteine ligase YbdK (ATP-grasp superfamily)